MWVTQWTVLVGLEGAWHLRWGLSSVTERGPQSLPVRGLRSVVQNFKESRNTCSLASTGDVGAGLHPVRCTECSLSSQARTPRPPLIPSLPRPPRPATAANPTEETAPSAVAATSSTSIPSSEATTPSPGASPPAPEPEKPSGSCGQPPGSGPGALSGFHSWTSLSPAPESAGTEELPEDGEPDAAELRRRRLQKLESPVAH